MSAPLLKHGSIWAFLGQLAKQVDSQRYQVVDHWDADLFAVGVAAVDEPRLLVYVSTFRQDPGYYVAECEAPEYEQDYRIPARGESIGFDAVVTMIRRHLGIDTLAISYPQAPATTESESVRDKELAMRVVDALLCASIVKPDDVPRAVAIATEQLEVRRALGDY